MSFLLFLGGTTNKSTWRDELIPLLEYESIPFFNPVVPNWDDEAYEREMFVKSLPNTIEVYVITKEMKGSYSIAEAVEASNKKPEKTIFLCIREGIGSDQLKSIDAVERILEKNGAYVVRELRDIVYAYKSICLDLNNVKVKKRLSKIANFTNEEILEATGVLSFLEESYISFKDLSQNYINIFINSIKDFIKNPLFKTVDLDNLKDLHFLRESDLFKSHIESTFDTIKSKLISRQMKVDKYLKTLDASSEVSLEDIMKNTNLDKVSLLVILHELKENNKIYDYNGRFVTLN